MVAGQSLVPWLWLACGTGTLQGPGNWPWNALAFTLMPEVRTALGKAGQRATIQASVARATQYELMLVA